MLAQLHSTRDLQMLEMGSIYKGPGRAIVQKGDPHDCNKLAHPSASRSPDSRHSLLSMVMGRGVLSGTTASLRYLYACHNASGLQ